MIILNHSGHSFNKTNMDGDRLFLKGGAQTLPRFVLIIIALADTSI
jgi:hypothetical protein